MMLSLHENIPYLILLHHCALRFFKITVKTFSIICIYLLRVHFQKRSAKDVFDDVHAIFLIFVIKAYVVGTRLNWLDLSRQFK